MIFRHFEFCEKHKIIFLPRNFHWSYLVVTSNLRTFSRSFIATHSCCNHILIYFPKFFNSALNHALILQWSPWHHYHHHYRSAAEQVTTSFFHFTRSWTSSVTWDSSIWVHLDSLRSPDGIYSCQWLLLSAVFSRASSSPQQLLHLSQIGCVLSPMSSLPILWNMKSILFCWLFL